MGQKALNLLVVVITLSLVACADTRPQAEATSSPTQTPEANALAMVTRTPTVPAPITPPATDTPSPTLTVTPQPTATAQTPLSETTATAIATQIPSPQATAIGTLPLFEEATCRFPQPQWAQVACGYLVVLEDRNNPGGNVVKLPVALFRTANPNPQPDPVVYLTGGGGGNELDNLNTYRNVILQVLRERDYIMYNQRGAKYAIPYLQCPRIAVFYADLLRQALTREESEERELAYYRQCNEDFRSQGYDMNLYNSAVNAADLNDLRIALGYETINIYGTSYGTRLGLAVMRDYPEGIRSAILDSVYPPQVGINSEYAANAYAAFRRVFEACATDETCSRRYPDPEGQLLQVIDSLNRRPKSMTSGGLTFTYDGADLLDALYLFPYIHRGEELPAAIYEASRGVYTTVEPMMPYVKGLGSYDTIAAGVQNALLCREEVPYEPYQRLVEFGGALPKQFFETYASDFQWRLCEALAIDPADPIANEPVTSDVPTLILEGQFDPITPVEWGLLAAETLNNSYFYEFPGVGHGVMRSNECGLAIGLQFIEDPLRQPDASCIDRMEPISLE